MEDEEIHKFTYAGKMAWEYLCEIGITDMALLDKEQGRQLMYVIVKAYHEAPPF